MGWMKKRRVYWVGTVLILMSFTLALIANAGFSGVSSHSYVSTKDQEDTEEDETIKPEDQNFFRYYRMFQEVYQILQGEFVKPHRVTAKRLLYGAIKGMLEATQDPYTTFLEPKVARSFSAEISGKFGGIGIRIGLRDKWLTIIAPIKNTPASRADLQAGDRIIKINTNSTEGMSADEAVTLMRGKPGTPLQITIARSGMKPFPVDLVREEIKIDTVESAMIPANNQNYAYIKILEFSLPTAQEFERQIRDLLEQDPDALIVDLRNNPGGLLNVVSDIVNMFFDKGVIVYTKGRLPQDNQTFYSQQGTIIPKDLPMVVLINQGSASASEIFSGAMQDTHRALLLGMKSFGKGSVQKTKGFAEDSSIIKYTVALYHTPSGRVIDGKGLTPDVEVKLWYDKLTDEQKVSLFHIESSDEFKEFIKTNQDPTTEQINALLSIEKDFGRVVPRDLFESALRQRIFFRYNPTGLYNLEVDDQLQAALELLPNYDEYQTNEVQIYETVQ